jgi:hypothetical protein
MEKSHQLSVLAADSSCCPPLLFLETQLNLQDDSYKRSNHRMDTRKKNDSQLVVAEESRGESVESVIEKEPLFTTMPCLLVEESDADVLERGIVVQSPVFTYMYNSTAPLNSEDNKETSESKTKTMMQYQFLGSVCPTSAEALDNAVVFHVSSVLASSSVDDPPFLSLDELSSTDNTDLDQQPRLVEVQMQQQQNYTNNNNNDKKMEDSEGNVVAATTPSLTTFNHVHRLVKMLPSLSGDDTPLIISDEEKKILKLQQDVTTTAAEKYSVENSLDDITSTSVPGNLLAFRTVVKRATSTGQLDQQPPNTVADLYPICELTPTIDFPSYQSKQASNPYLPQTSFSESSSVCTESTENSSTSLIGASTNLHTTRQSQQQAKHRPTLSRQFKSSDRLLQEAVQYSEAVGEKPPRSVEEISREIIDPEDDEVGSDDDYDDVNDNLLLELPCTTALNNCHNNVSSAFSHFTTEKKVISESDVFNTSSYNDRREHGSNTTSDTTNSLNILSNTNYEHKNIPLNDYNVGSILGKKTEICADLGQLRNDARVKNNSSPQQGGAGVVSSSEKITSSRRTFSNDGNVTSSVAIPSSMEQQAVPAACMPSLNLKILKHKDSMEDSPSSQKEPTSSLQLCALETMTPISATSDTSERAEFFYRNTGMSSNTNFSVHSLGKYMLNPQPRSTNDNSASSSYLGVKYHPPEITRGNYAQLHRKAWLEVSDKYHRYGKNLRLYYKYWNSLGHPFNMFFDWLDSKGEAAGQPLPNLPECPRSQLDSDTVLYITDPEVQDLYQLKIASRGEERFGYVLDANGNPVLTGEEGWIFVLRDGKFYGARKVTETAGLSKKRFHHSSFFAGKSVTAAGIFITKEEGRIACMYPHSGHYRPGEAHMQRLLYFLQRLGVDLNTFDIDVQQIAHVARKEVIQTLTDENNPDQKVEKRRKERKADSLYLTPASHVACFLAHKAKMLSKGVFGQIQNIRQVRAASVQEALDAVDNGGYWKQKKQKINKESSIFSSLATDGE